jgi:transposase InsO family protein
MGDTSVAWVTRPMPWKESTPVTERMQFMSRLIAGERMTDLCREFGISRKTGYKLRARFDELGVDGFQDLSRRPATHPNETPRKTVELVIGWRLKHPTWGARKIRKELQRYDSSRQWPVTSTISEILKRHGLVMARKRRRRATPSPNPLGDSAAPNDVWSIDFKGQFHLGNRRLCYPLTVSDHFSRYFITCEALEDTRRAGTQQALEAAFCRYGLPKIIRSDNGAPFASTGCMGLTRLSVWLMRQGIETQRIEPGRPDQNGRHERLHRTLKCEAINPAGANLLQQQQQFDAFLDCYNNARPHEALGQEPPVSVYAPSTREFDPCPSPLVYPDHDATCTVYEGGKIYLGAKRSCFHITAAFTGERLGLRQVNGPTWSVTFMDTEIGLLDTKSRLFLASTTGRGRSKV